MERVKIPNMVEVAYIDPGFILLDPAVHTIPAGTMAVIPHVPGDIRDENHRAEVEEDELDPNSIPNQTILVAGQSLERSLYPELSPIYAETGGFNYFTLPYLIKKFIIGVNHDTNEIMWGDAVIYYETIPALEVVKRDIRENM